LKSDAAACKSCALQHKKEHHLPLDLLHELLRFGALRSVSAASKQAA